VNLERVNIHDIFHTSGCDDPDDPSDNNWCQVCLNAVI
jgi:hypothetical protein